MPQNWDDEFEDLVSSLANLVGDNEIEARQAMGDEQYEKVVRHLDRSAELAIQKDEAQIRYLTVLSGLHGSISIILFFAAAMSLAWSIYYWVS